jgi:general secretion pathway protein D
MPLPSSLWRGSSRALACAFAAHVAHAAAAEPAAEPAPAQEPSAPTAADQQLSEVPLPPASERAAREPPAHPEQQSAASAGEQVARVKGAEFRPTPGGQAVQLNLVDVSLGELIQHMSRLTGKRFIFDSKLKRLDVTVIAPTPVTVDEAYEAFLAILAQNGLNVVPHGPFLKVIESGTAAHAVAPLRDAKDPAGRGDAASAAVVTELRRVENVSATDAAGVLASFKSPHGDIVVYEPGGLLIITDTRAHVQRLGRLLEEIDVGSSRSRLWVQPVHYGQASDYAAQIEQVFGVDPAAPNGLSRVIADEATNRLIIVGHDDAYAKLLEFLTRVDVAPAAAGAVSTSCRSRTPSPKSSRRPSRACCRARRPRRAPERPPGSQHRAGATARAGAA